MSSETPKQAMFAQFALVAKALGHAHRLELLEFLAQGERGVDSLAERVGLKVANASQHLQQLRRAGLVMSRRVGKHIFYRLSEDSVVNLLGALRGIAEQNLAEVREIANEYFHARDNLEAVSRQELVARMHDGAITILDVRPEDEYLAGHLPSALNIPLNDLESRLDDLPHEQEVIAYCRGTYCVLSFEAVAALRARGYNVRRLEEGYPEWKAAGLPVAGMS